MSEKDITRKIYEKMMHSHGLPEYHNINPFLDITLSEDEDAFIRIKKSILEKIERYIDIIDPIVQPDTTAVSMYENSMFPDDEKTRAFELFRKLMTLKREGELTYLDESERSNSEFIKEFFRCVKDINKDMRDMITRQKDSWKNNSKIKESNTGYFG